MEGCFRCVPQIRVEAAKIATSRSRLLMRLRSNSPLYSRISYLNSNTQPCFHFVQLLGTVKPFADSLKCTLPSCGLSYLLHVPWIWQVECFFFCAVPRGWLRISAERIAISASFSLSDQYLCCPLNHETFNFRLSNRKILSVGKCSLYWQYSHLSSSSGTDGRTDQFREGFDNFQHDIKEIGPTMVSAWNSVSNCC